MGAVGVDLHRFQHGGRRTAGPQAAELMLQRLRGALHAALQFVDVETRRGHNPLPFSKFIAVLLPAFGLIAARAAQPATMVPWPVPRKIAPIEPGSAIENTMIGSDVSRAS